MTKAIILFCTILSTIPVFAQWTELTNAPSAQRVSQVNGNLYLGTNVGVYESTDGGNNWTLLSSVDASPSTAYYEIMDINGTWFLGSSTGGMYYSTDNGHNWTRDTAGSGNIEVRGVHFDGVRIFMGTGNWVPPNFFYRKLSETSWHLPDSIEGMAGSGPLFYDFETFNDTLYGISSKGLYFSPDSGKTWLETDEPVKGERMIKHNGHLYVYGLIEAIFRTSDGSSWTNIDETYGLAPMGSNNLWWPDLMFSDGTNLFMSQGTTSETYIWMSSDNGDTWTNIGDTSAITRGLTSMAMINNELYAVTKAPSAKLYKYTGSLPVNLKEEASQVLSFYPNPAENVIHFTNDNDVVIKIFDMFGRMVIQQNIPADGKLEVSEIPAGCYLLQSGQSNHSQLLIIH